MFIENDRSVERSYVKPLNTPLPSKSALVGDVSQMAYKKKVIYEIIQCLPFTVIVPLVRPWAEPTICNVTIISQVQQHFTWTLPGAVRIRNAAIRGRSHFDDVRVSFSARYARAVHSLVVVHDETVRGTGEISLQ